MKRVTKKYFYLACTVLVPILLVTLICYLFSNIFGYAALFLFFLLTTVLITYLGGILTGLISVILSTLIIWILFVSPSLSLRLSELGQVVDLAAFAGTAFVLVIILNEFNILTHLLNSKSQDLRDSEERLRKILDTVPAMIFMTDTKGEWTLINQAFLEFFGYPTHIRSSQSHWFTRIHDDDKTPVYHELKSAIDTRALRKFRCRVRVSDDEYGEFLVQMKPRFERLNVFKGYIATIIDLTPTRPKPIQKFTDTPQVESPLNPEAHGNNS